MTLGLHLESEKWEHWGLDKSRSVKKSPTVIGFSGLIWTQNSNFHLWFLSLVLMWTWGDQWLSHVDKVAVSQPYLPLRDNAICWRGFSGSQDFPSPRERWSSPEQMSKVSICPLWEVRGAGLPSVASCTGETPSPASLGEGRYFCYLFLGFF